jgi:dGTPase
MDWNKLLSDERLRHTTRTHNKYDERNEFESDYGRIIFSPALRRMHDKTQVFPLINDDNTHTRLTHSLEVSTLAKSLGINLCSNPEFKKRINYEKGDDLFRIIPEILSSISLCHDIGNPPFGHFGEVVISKYFEQYFASSSNHADKLNLSKEQKDDFIHFNGNAQGFRVLTKQQVLQDIYGLNLTFATLGAFLKYPNLSNELGKQGYRKKLGVFQSEKDFLDRIRLETSLNYKSRTY